MTYNISPFLEKTLGSILAILGTVVLASLLSRLSKKFIHDPSAKYSMRKRIIYGSTVFALVLVVTIWAEMLSGFTTFLGIIGAGIALALKDPLTSIAGWFYLAVTRVYQLGDRIEIRDLKGDVVDISVFHTTLLEVHGWVDGEQSTGRLVNIPHNWLFSNKVFNYTKAFSFIWTEISMVITFESNWKKAYEIATQKANEIAEDIPVRAEEAIRSASHKFLIKLGRLTPIVYLSVVDSGVKVSIRFLTPVRMRRTIQCKLFEAILEELDREEDVNLAYTTYRIVDK